MAAKFVENFIFLRGIGERNDVRNMAMTPYFSFYRANSIVFLSCK